jgi:hypothetical protein
METAKQDRTEARATLLDLFNNTLAGRLASDELNEALCRDWLPAMAALLKTRSPASADAVLVRRTLVRLGWVLQNLPQAESIHPSLLDRAIRECRSDWRALVPQLFADHKTQVRHAQLLDSELLDSLQVSAQVHRYAPSAERRPIAPLVSVRNVPVAVHPHDRQASGTWQAVLAGSRGQRRDDDGAVDALTRVSRLRAGDRVLMLLPGGLKETWRVLRRESARDNVLLENENSHRQGVLGLQTMAAQLEQGRLAILG